MPRARSKSRTPGKKHTPSHAVEEPIERQAVNDSAMESSLTASTLKRPNTRSTAITSNLPVSSQSSPRRRRASSASENPGSPLAKGRSEEKVDETTPTAKNDAKSKTPHASLTKAKSPKAAEKVDSTPKRSKKSGTQRKPPESPRSNNSKSLKDESILKTPKQSPETEVNASPTIPATSLHDKVAPPQHPPTLDVKVHRVRHLDYIPSQIVAMASSASWMNHDESSLVAVSRLDGSLELLETTFIQDYATSNNGNKTKWSPHLFPLATVAGSQRAVAHSLAFADASGGEENRSHLTLVAASPDGTLWTVQLAGQPRQLQSRISSNGGGIFDLTTCHNSSPLSSLVAGACQDGSVRIWQVSRNQESGVLKIQDPPVATLSTAGASILSVAWRCEKQVGNNFSTAIFAGAADGTIRKYVVELQKAVMDGSIQCLKHKSDLRMTVESRGRKTPTKVWTMQALNDGSLVTGNSLGQIQIFDTLTGTLMQSINQTELKADVLRVAVNAAQTKIFASGVDSRVVCLERSGNSANASLGPGMIWKFTTAQRPHTHDVKCMAIVQGKATSDGTLKEALVTGGVDTKLCTYLVSDFAKKRPQVYYPWPSQSPVSTTSSCIGEDIGSRRILSIHRHNQIELYRLEDGLQDTNQPTKDTTRSTSELIGEIALETQSNLAFSTLCPAGRWLAAANATKLFLFRLNWARKVKSTEDGGHEAEMDVDLQPDKVDLPEGLDKLTVTAIYFGSSNILYIADSRRRLFVVDLSKDEAKTVSTLQIPNLGEDWTLPICSIKASADNSFVAILTKTDKDGGIHVFRRLQGGNNGYAHYWAVPGLTGARPAAVTFVGSSQLAVATVSFQIFVFDLESRKLSPWSEENKFPIEKWPTEISHRKDFPVRLFSNPKDHSQLIMSSFGMFVVVNLDGPLPKNCRMIPEMHVRRKRKRHEDVLAATPRKDHPIVFAPPPLPAKGNTGPGGIITHNHNNSNNSKANHDPHSRNCTVCLNYNSMIHFDFLANDEMVVVEQPWLRVISKFPEALQRRVYGFN